MEELFSYRDWSPRWASFENPLAAKGAGGQRNRGAKGNAFEALAAGETKTLLEMQGSGVIHRIWMTVRDRSPAMLREMRMDMYWDGAASPAVSAPLGDLFCVSLGRLVPFENELFSSPEGRSFNLSVPMPFRRGARVTITNESAAAQPYLFYDIDFSLVPEHASDTLYFHAYWNRERPTRLGRDYAILPQVRGKGRFLGMNVGVACDPRYTGSWWGEGEVKMYADGDGAYPTLAGTGVEDYIGTAWGQGEFAHRYQGCPLWNSEREYGFFYRLHIRDPIYFRGDCRVAIQQIGGAHKGNVRKIADRGAPLNIITADANGRLIRFLEADRPPDWRSEEFPERIWLNFQREDDYSSIAYFYLDSPENGLPPLAAAQRRSEALPQP